MGLNESEVVTGKGVKTCQHTSAFHICEVAIFQEGNFYKGQGLSIDQACSPMHCDLKYRNILT